MGESREACSYCFTKNLSKSGNCAYNSDLETQGKFKSKSKARDCIPKLDLWFLHCFPKLTCLHCTASSNNTGSGAALYGQAKQKGSSLCVSYSLKKKERDIYFEQPLRDRGCHKPRSPTEIDSQNLQTDMVFELSLFPLVYQPKLGKEGFFGFCT